MHAIRHALVAVALASSASLGGCLSDASPLSVEGFFQIKNNETTCVVDSGGDPLVNGSLDVTKGTGYIAGVSVNNGLGESEDPNELRVDTNTIEIHTIVTTYTVSEGASIAAPPGERIPVGALVKPGAGVFLPAQILSPANGESLSGATDGDYLIVSVSFEGRTTHGSSVTSTAAQFPIKLCSGCLRNPCPADQDLLSCSPGQPDGNACVAKAP